MQPTIEILDRIRKNSRDNKEEIFTRLYRYLLRPDLYYLAYKNFFFFVTEAASDGSSHSAAMNATNQFFIVLSFFVLYCSSAICALNCLTALTFSPK